MSVSIQDKIQDKLPFINPRAKSLIEELYENLKILPEEQNQQREICTKLLDEIIDSLIDNSLLVENTINETQIDILLNQTKFRLENIREKFLTSTINIESFNVLFGELTECVEVAYKIMSNIFQYVSKKTNDLTKANQTLSTQMDDIKTTNNQLFTDNQSIREKLAQLEEQESKRTEKEKRYERQILIRDLFLIPMDRLCEELRHNNLSETQVAVFSRSKIDIKKLLSDYPSLYSILQRVSDEFEIDPTNMLNYIKEKKYGNNYFHLNVEITKYANDHTNYDLNQFLIELNMHSLDENEYILLQPVFTNICRKINKDD